MKGIIFDLDMTLIDSKKAEGLRNNHKWNDVYKLIPELKPYAGINELLSYLKKFKIKTAIVTSSPQTYCDKITNYNKWNFDVKVCYHDTKLHKPSPDPLLYAVSKLNIEKKYVISVGDRDSDIISSKNAGINSVACTWGAENKETLLKSKPDFIVNNVNDFYAILKL